MKVKAISLWEPWASLMRAGHKHNETRSWATSYRGPLLICAAKTQAGLTEETEFIIPMLMNALADGTPPEHLLSFGKAVALVNVVTCVPTDLVSRSSTERNLGDYTPGRYAWITKPIDTTFEPFPVKGQQGFFTAEVEEGRFKL